MIDNKYLNELYKINDRNDALNKLLEDLYKRHEKIIKEISIEVPKLNLCNKKELDFLTICAAIIEYKLMELHQVIPPKWLFDNRLKFKKPFFYQKRFLDGKKENLLESNPAPLKQRNVYFELSSLTRI